ncbi:inorganic diphosphatase [Rhodocaloribacter sp.]
MRAPPSFARRIADRFDWAGWETLITRNGYTIDRPYGSAHPRFPDILYPIDYGYVNDTLGGDGEEVDLFVGSARNGLVALILTHDHRRGDRECKLIYDCTPEEVYLVNGFINYDRSLMEGRLVMRRPMRELWSKTPRRTPPA